MISNSSTINNKTSYSISSSIPKEINFQFDIITITGSSEDSGALSHSRQTTHVENSLTVFEDNTMAGLSVNNGDAVSLSSDDNSSDEISDMLPR